MSENKAKGFILLSGVVVLGIEWLNSFIKPTHPAQRIRLFIAAGLVYMGLSVLAKFRPAYAGWLAILIMLGAILQRGSGLFTWLTKPGRFDALGGVGADLGHGGYSNPIPGIPRYDPGGRGKGIHRAPKGGPGTGPVFGGGNFSGPIVRKKARLLKKIFDSGKLRLYQYERPNGTKFTVERRYTGTLLPFGVHTGGHWVTTAGPLIFAPSGGEISSTVPELPDFVLTP